MQAPEQSSLNDATSATPNFPLAGRGQRLLAKILDGLAEGIPMIPIAIYLGLADYFRAVTAEEMVVIPIKLVLQLAVAKFVVHLLMQGYLLYFYGQTIGKRLMGIAIVNRQDRVPSFNRIIGLRYLPFYAASQIPWVSSLALLDLLFIFREDRRCLHDLLADTRVIDVSSRMNG